MSTPNVQKIFPLAVNCGAKSISTANANRNGTGTIIDVFVAGANGSQVTRLTVGAQGTVVADIVRLYVYDGATYFLYEEIPVLAVTATGLVPAWSGQSLKINVSTSLFLPTGYKLGAAPNLGQTYNVFAEGADF